MALPLPDFNNSNPATTRGPVLLAALLQCLCQGVIFGQSVKYWERFAHSDALYMKIFLGIVVLLSILQSVLEIYKSWRYEIEDRIWYSTDLAWADLILNGVICLMCELMLMQRCWKILHRGRWFVVVLAFLAMTQLVCLIYVSASIQTIAHEALSGRISEVPQSLLFRSAGIAFSYWCFGTLALDWFLTSIIVVYLWGSKTGLGHLDKALNDIIDIAWESAAPPSIFMLVAVILWHVQPHYEFILFLVLATGKLYTLGLLRTMNSRALIREQMSSGALGRTSLTFSRDSGQLPRSVSTVLAMNAPLELTPRLPGWRLMRQRSVSVGAPAIRRGSAASSTLYRTETQIEGKPPDTEIDKDMV